MSRVALITGITGQDGSYLAEFLLEKGYKVFGLVRRLSTPNLGRIQHILGKVSLIEGDLLDQSSLGHALEVAKPEEVYNLASQSFVATSWTQPILTGEVTGLGAARLFEAVRAFNKGIRIYQASSSEMFGKVEETPQCEETRFHPISPYACAKVYAHNSAVTYRESYGMFICNGIMFNHESPRRGLEFVTRKITSGAVKINRGLERELRLGNLDAKRDWGYAGDYVEAMWPMLQRAKPDDFIIATGETHTVREFVECAFGKLGMDWRHYVKVDERFFRPADVMELCGNASKAKHLLSWEPKMKFKQLVDLMVEAEG